MNISEVFNQVERQKMWDEIVIESNYYKEAQKIMDFGYAQGIVFMLSVLKECNEEFGNAIYKTLYLDNPKESNIDKMVKRLMKDK